MNTIDPVKQERSGNVREVGSQAIWSLSTCKPGVYTYGIVNFPLSISGLFTLV